MTEQEQIEIVSKDGLQLQYINNPSEAVQIAAINQNLKAFLLIEKPSNKVKSFWRWKIIA